MISDGISFSSEVAMMRHSPTSIVPSDRCYYIQCHLQNQPFSAHPFGAFPCESFDWTDNHPFAARCGRGAERIADRLRHRIPRRRRHRTGSPVTAPHGGPPPDPGLHRHGGRRRTVLSGIFRSADRGRRAVSAAPLPRTAERLRRPLSGHDRTDGPNTAAERCDRRSRQQIGAIDNPLVQKNDAMLPVRLHIRMARKRNPDQAIRLLHRFPARLNVCADRYPALTVQIGPNAAAERCDRRSRQQIGAIDNPLVQKNDAMLPVRLHIRMARKRNPDQTIRLLHRFPALASSNG